MKIYVPTFDRELSQITYDNLPNFMQELVVFVVQPEERAFFKKHYPNVMVLPFDNIGIAKTRQHIMESAGDEKYFVFGDDLKFYMRNKYFGLEGTQTLLNENVWLHVLERVYILLDEYTYGGFSTLGSFPVKKKNEYVHETYNTGVFTAYFFNGKKLKEAKVEWDSTYDFLEDVDFNFQLLSKGFKSARLNAIAWKQNPRASGGCESAGRTPEVQQTIWKALYSKWPFMSIAKNIRKSAYHTEATRYVCKWKQAYRCSQNIQST